MVLTMPLDFNLSTGSSSVDLSRLPAPTVVEQLSFEAIFAAMIADIQARLPSFDATVESDPAVKVLQVAAYRELLLRQTFNDRARGIMLAYALGTDLDNLAALVGVSRLVIQEADALNNIPEILEDDDALRQRVVLAPESFSVAGPELAYVFHARTAHAEVLDASATSPVPGEVVVTVLSREGDGTASPEVLAAVEAVVNGRPVRPLTDLVTVQSVEVVPFTIEAQLFVFKGPDASLIVDAALAKLTAHLAASRLIGRDFTFSALNAALHVEGVQRVQLVTPLATIPIGPTQVAHCTAVDVTFGGYDN